MGWLVISSCHAQSVVDSLKDEIANAPDVRTKIELQRVLVDELFEINLEEAYQVSNEILRDSRKAKYTLGEGWARIYRGTYYLLIGLLDQSYEESNAAYQIGRTIPNLDLMANAQMQMGKSFRDRGLFDTARVRYLKAEAIELQADNPAGLVKIYSALSHLMLIMEEQNLGLEYAEKALELAQKYSDKTRIAYAWLDKGDCHRDLYDYKKANEAYRMALKVGGNQSWIKIDYKESTGFQHYYEGNLDAALKNFIDVAKAYEQSDGHHTLARILVKSAEVMNEKGLYDLSLEYLTKSLKISQTAGYKYHEADAMYESGWVYMRLGNLEEAKRSIRKAVKLFQICNVQVEVGGCYNLMGIIAMKEMKLDSSLYYHNLGLDIRKNFGRKWAISSSLFNLGDLYIAQKKFDAAYQCFSQSHELDSLVGDKYGVGLNKQRMGKILIIKGDFSKAESYLNEALELAEETTSFDLLRICLDELSVLHESNGQWEKAVHYRRKYEQYTDSLFTKATAESMSAYRVLYDLDEKDARINFLNQETLLRDEQLRKRNIIIVSVVSGAFLLLILLYVFYLYGKRLKRLNREINEQYEEIQTQSEELQESNQALSNLNSEISTQREEIQHQAEELRVSHETIGKINEGLEKMVEQRTNELRSAYQELDTFFYRSSHDFRRPLTTLMGLAEVAKLSVKDSSALELFEKVSVTAVNLDKMLVKLQSISDVGSHQLVFKEVLLKQIIENAMEPHRDLLRERQARIVVDVKLVKPFISYPALVKIVMENLIENAVNFSNPNHPQILVRAYRAGSTVFVEVEDNGEGISEEVKAHVFEMFFRGSERSIGNGLGLYIAKKALEKISGKISFVANREHPGTTFKIEIPDQG